ncbi:hypothetical protein DPMN_062482 [Dreissena polymorpha]|uniref:Uncharacterized protein n=1 Tax=Dreissena polymorpha TaxID=45954 RepID=A0A9D4C9J7_DREPO|nr:hypothetical protein DPMN_062482 [Dreissena polymorpha]
MGNRLGIPGAVDTFPSVCLPIQHARSNGAYFKCAFRDLHQRLRPYHVERTGSRPTTAVKQRRARPVLGWVTAWEYRVP